MKPVSETQENRQPLIDGRDLFTCKLTERAPDSALVDRSQMVDQREGLLGEAAPARREWRVEKSLTRGPGYGHYAH